MLGPEPEPFDYLFSVDPQTYYYGMYGSTIVHLLDPQLFSCLFCSVPQSGVLTMRVAYVLRLVFQSSSLLDV